MPSRDPRSMLKNIARTCVHPGCRNNRHRYSSACATHERRLKLYGSVRGVPIAPKVYATEQAEVDDFVLKLHPEHPAIVAAISFIQKWVDAALRGETVKAAKALQRLTDLNVTAPMVFCRAIAIQLYLLRNPRALPDPSLRAQDFAISLAVLGLVPMDVTRKPASRVRVRKPHPGASRRELGPTIRETLSPVFAGIVTGLEGQRAAERAAVDALAIAFTPIV